MLRYRVAHLFAHDGHTYTNDDEEAIRKLPREVRDRHIERGNLIEWDGPSLDAAPTATPNDEE